MLHDEIENELLKITCELRIKQKIVWVLFRKMERIIDLVQDNLGEHSSSGLPST